MFLNLLFACHLIFSQDIKAQRLSNGCGLQLKDDLVRGESNLVEIEVDDPVQGKVLRSALLFIPQNYKPQNPYSLVVDYHGWGGSAPDQELQSRFIEVSEMDGEDFLVCTPNGMADGGGGSFNVSRTDGPLGPPCDTDRFSWGEYDCYDSCPSCDRTNSCDWTSCHDDIIYTRTLVSRVEDMVCVDLDSVHQTGWSNGGMFSYFAAAQLNDIFSSFCPLSGAPLVGFGEMPSSSVNLLDIHGLNDNTIPYDLQHSLGEGPHGSIITQDGYYYEAKPDVIRKWVEAMECSSSPVPWLTEMDGIMGWSCQAWQECRDNVQIVSCTGEHGHEYPFGQDQHIQGARIVWKFMNSLQKQQSTK